MGTVYTRGRKLWLAFVDGAGERQWKPTGLEVGEEEQAAELLKRIEDRVAAQRALGVDDGQAGKVTLKRWVKRWIERRKVEIETWRDDEIRLNLHVLPRLGSMVLADIRPRHLDELFHDLRARGKMGAHTMRNVYGTVRALFRDAAIAGLVGTSPCILTARQLGDDVFVDPVAQATNRYSRRQLELMVFSPALAPDENVFAAIGGLAGMRLGEIGGLRWQDMDPDAEPLGRFTVARSYGKKTTKTKKIRLTPIHPTLAAILAEWKLGGWPAMFGRPPEPGDLIVPRPPRKSARAPGGMHTKKTGALLMHRILAALKIPVPAKLTHALRSTFISIALEDGADPYLLEMVTHTTKRGRSAFDVYARIGWPKLCEQVERLRLERPASATGQVVSIAGARTEVRSGTVTVCDSGDLAAEDHRRKRVEAPGVEGGSDRGSKSRSRPASHRTSRKRDGGAADE